MSATTIVELTTRFREHAQGSNGADDSSNLADYIWALKHGGTFVDHGQVWANLVNDFEALNSVFNEPSSDEVIIRPILYAISGLITQCCDYVVSDHQNEMARKQVMVLAWRITTAWDAVLAGDIESIDKHVELEIRAKAIKC